MTVTYSNGDRVTYETFADIHNWSGTAQVHGVGIAVSPSNNTVTVTSAGGATLGTTTLTSGSGMTFAKPNVNPAKTGATRIVSIEPVFDPISGVQTAEEVKIFVGGKVVKSWITAKFDRASPSPLLPSGVAVRGSIGGSENE